MADSSSRCGVLAVCATAWFCAACMPTMKQRPSDAIELTLQQDTADPARLRPASAFTGISDRHARSAAIFVEASRVIRSPRCLNCHLVQRSPTQGDNLRPHVPFITAGTANHGSAGLQCNACHGAANVATLSSPIQTIPGDPHWRLAPLSMAWQGKTLSKICAQLKGSALNGGRTLEQLHEYMAGDHLVGWGWRPGEGRAPAPGTQKDFGGLIRAWIDTGAACPDS